MSVYQRSSNSKVQDLENYHFGALAKMERAKDLLGACIMGDHNLLTLLLKEGVDLDTEVNGMYPITSAVISGHIMIVRTLLNHGAKVNVKDQRGDSALLVACHKGDLELVELLIERGADVNLKNNNGWTALIRASQLGHTEIVEFLIKHGAEVNIESIQKECPLHRATYGEHTETVKSLLDHGASIDVQNSHGVSPLHCASAVGHTEIVRVLLDRGATVNLLNINGRPPLIRASNKGYTEIVQLLLEHGALVNIQDKDGLSALIAASVNGLTEAVVILLEHGAKVDAQEKNGLSALTGASMSGHAKTAKVLLEREAEVDAQQANEATPLIRASLAGHTETVKILLDHGAEPYIKEKPLSALNVASWTKNTKTLQTLIDASCHAHPAATVAAQNNHEKALQLNLFPENVDSAITEELDWYLQIMKSQDEILAKISEIQSSFAAVYEDESQPTDEPSLSSTLQKLFPLVKHWKSIGIWLGLSAALLDKIGRENQYRERDCLREVLEEWLKMIDPHPTWKRFDAAVKQIKCNGADAHGKWVAT